MKATTLYMMMKHGAELGLLDETDIVVEANGITCPVSAIVKGDGFIALRARVESPEQGAKRGGINVNVICKDLIPLKYFDNTIDT